MGMAGSRPVLHVQLGVSKIIHRNQVAFPVLRVTCLPVVPTVCNACALGFYTISGLSPCDVCAAGSYCTNTSSIAPCPTGSWSETTGLTLSSMCTPCLAGTYGTIAGQTSLATGCSFTCDAGTYGNITGRTAAGDACTACLPGSFCSGGASIAACPAGSYSNGTDLTSAAECALCTAGSFGNVTGRTTASAACAACSPGSYCGGGAQVSPCPAGSYSSSNSLIMSAACTPCHAGSYGNSSGLTTAAVACPFACAAGTYGNVTGKTTASAACVACLDGSYCTGGASIIFCPTGFFCSASCTSPVACAPLSYCPSNSTSQLPCPAGWDCTDITKPVFCSIGTWSALGSSDCIACAGGTYGASTPLASQSQCTGCTVGTYCSGGAAIPLVCSAEYLCPANVTSPAAATLVVAFVNPLSSFQLGSGLLVLQAYTDGAASSSLQYTWSFISLADQASDFMPTFLPPSSSPLLQLDPSLLLPDTTYNFSVRVVDTKYGDGSGAALSSVASTTVRVLLTTQQIHTSADVDPCSAFPSFQCFNGGLCVAADTVPGSFNYTLTCTCPSSPVAFLGASCNFALLECPNGNALYAEGTDVALYGIGFNTLSHIAVAGRVVQFENDAALNSSSRDAEWQGVFSRWPSYANLIQRVRFVAPALVTNNRTTTTAARLRLLMSSFEETNTTALVVNPPAAYQMLTLSSFLLADGSGSGKLLQTNVSNLLFYSSSTCRSEGQWKEDGVGGCLPCPDGPRTLSHGCGL